MSKKEYNDKKVAQEPVEQPNTAEIRDVLDDTSESTDDADITVEEAQQMIDEVNQLKTALEKEKKEYLFLRADFDNYRKRMLKDREELLRNAGEKVLKGLLPDRKSVV